jgi:hypothetical protein
MHPVTLRVTSSNAGRSVLGGVTTRSVGTITICDLRVRRMPFGLMKIPL